MYQLGADPLGYIPLAGKGVLTAPVPPPTPSESVAAPNLSRRVSRWRLSRHLGYEEGSEGGVRSLYAYNCPEGGKGQYNARLVHNKIEGRPLYALVPCHNGSSSSGSGSGISGGGGGSIGGAVGASGGSSGVAPVYYMGRLIQKNEVGRELYAVENPCCEASSFSSVSSQSKSLGSGSSSRSSSSSGSFSSSSGLSSSSLSSGSSSSSSSFSSKSGSSSGSSSSSSSGSGSLSSGSGSSSSESSSSGSESQPSESQSVPSSSSQSISSQSIPSISTSSSSSDCIEGNCIDCSAKFYGGNLYASVPTVGTIVLVDDGTYWIGHRTYAGCTPTLDLWLRFSRKCVLEYGCDGVGWHGMPSTGSSHCCPTFTSASFTGCFPGTTCNPDLTCGPYQPIVITE